MDSRGNQQQHRRVGSDVPADHSAPAPIAPAEEAFRAHLTAQMSTPNDAQPADNSAERAAQSEGRDMDQASLQEEQRRESWAAAAMIDLSVTPARPQPERVSPRSQPAAPGSVASCDASGPPSALPSPAKAAPLRASSDGLVHRSVLLPSSLARVDQHDAAVVKDLTAIVAGWLQDRGLQATLSALRCETAMGARGEYTFRKALRSTALAISEGRWDAAHHASRNLFSALYSDAATGQPLGHSSSAGTGTAGATQQTHHVSGVGGASSGVPQSAGPQQQHQGQTTNQSSNKTGSQPSASSVQGSADGGQGLQGSPSNAPQATARRTAAQLGSAASMVDANTADRRFAALLLQQQILELVDGGDGPKAFSIFTKRFKQLEPYVPAAMFQRLLYAVTCRTVAEAAAAPGCGELASWSVEAGRASLLTAIRRELVASHVASEGHHGDVLASDTYITRHASPVVPGLLHTLVEHAASYNVLRAAVAEGHVALDDEDVAALEALADPLRQPDAVSRPLLPVAAQLPPHHVLRRLSLPPPSRTIGGAATGVCRVGYCSITRRMLVGGSDGTLSVTGGGADGLVAFGQHNGAVSAIAMPDIPAERRSQSLHCPFVSASLDGTARLWLPSVFGDGSSGYSGSLLRVSNSGSRTSAFTSAAMSPDSSLAIVADASGTIHVFRTNVGVQPVSQSARHILRSCDGTDTQQPSVPPSVMLEELGCNDAKCPPQHVRSIVTETRYVGDSPVEAHAPAHAVAAVPAVGKSAVVSVIPWKCSSAGCWALQRDGTVLSVNLAVGCVLRRFWLPDSSSNRGDASAFAITKSAMHAFVGLGAQGCVRLLSLADGSWRPDVFVTTLRNGGAAGAVTCVCVTSDDGYLLVGTGSGHVLVFQTLVPRNTTAQPAATPCIAAGGDHRREHRAVREIQVGSKPVADLRPMESGATLPTGRMYAATFGDGPDAAGQQQSAGPSTATSSAPQQRLESNRFLAITTSGDAVVLSSTKSGWLA